MTTPATTKIVIVSGQEFSVPRETDNEAIRAQLASQGFADVASATIQKGKRTIEGQEVETIEFVKKAGTKGLDGAALAALLGKVPPATLPARIIYGPTPAQAELLTQLADGELTFDAALALEDTFEGAFNACWETPRYQEKKGAQLCATLDQLVAVALQNVSVAW